MAAQRRARAGERLRRHRHACSPGVTGPASAVTAASATLNGVVVPGGEDTTYQFLISTAGASPRRVAAAATVSGTTPALVHADLTGLIPSATYHYQLQTTNSMGTISAQQQAFTTPAAPVPALAITASSLPAGKAGRKYSATLAAAGGTPPRQRLVTRGHLPAGLQLGQATGVISGRLRTGARTNTFTITVIDAGSPSEQAASKTLTVKVG